MNNLTKDLNTFAHQAKVLHDLYLQALIDKRIGRMDDSQLRLSNALQLIESIAFWRHQAEWAMKHRNGSLAESALSQLNQAVEQYEEFVGLNQGVEEFLVHVNSLLAAERSTG